MHLIFTAELMFLFNKQSTKNSHDSSLNDNIEGNSGFFPPQQPLYKKNESDRIYDILTPFFKNLINETSVLLEEFTYRETSA